MSNFMKRLILLVLLSIPMLSMSQVMVEQYALESGVDSLKWMPLPEDTTVTRTLISDGGDMTSSTLTDIGFNFSLGMEVYTQFSVNTDGNLKLGAPATTASGYSWPFSTTSINFNLPKINGLGCDGYMDSSGYVKYALIGTAPSRILVVEFKLGKYSYLGDSPSDLMWQVQLYETTNAVQLVYGSTAPVVSPDEFQIGMATTSTDVVTINILDSILTLGTSDVYQSVWPAPNTYYNMYVPTCFRPSGLQVVDMDATSAQFTWNTPEGQSAWEYICVANGVTPNWSMATVVTTASAIVTDLTPNTDYVMYLRADCGGDGKSDVSELSFHTDCVSLTTPYFEGFESYAEMTLPFCWSTVNDGTKVKQNTSWSQVAFTGENALYVGSGDIAIAPAVSLAANEMVLNVKVKAEDLEGGTLDIGYVTSTTGSDFVPVVTINPIHNAYVEYSVDFSSLNIADTVKVAFRHTPGMYAWYSFYLDDIIIERKSTCIPPAYSYVNNITHNSAIVEWEANDEVMFYEIAYGLSDTLANAVVETSTPGDNTLTLMDLISDTAYHVWIRSKCESDSSSWRSVGEFITKPTCAQVLNAHVSYVGNTSASISWTIDDSYGEISTGVEISYKMSIDTVWSVPIVPLGGNYYIFQDLDGGRSYDVRLRTLCGEDSASYVMLNFTTFPCGTEIAGGTMESSELIYGGYYNYNYTQMIYPASELAVIDDTIRGVAFRHTSSTTDQVRKVDVYIGHVNQATVTPSTPIAAVSMIKVVSDLYVDVSAGWIPILFDTVFVYDGISNLVVAIDDNTGLFSSNISTYYHNTGTTIYKRHDNMNLDPANPSSIDFSTIIGAPDIMFISSCETTGCVAPTIAFSDVSSNSITLDWNAIAAVTSWVVGYKVAATTDWTYVSATDETYTIENLLSGTLYDVCVGAICNSDTLFSYSQAFTDCISYEIPFEENFDDGDLSCWTIGSKTGNITDISIHPTEQILQFGYSGGGYIITPAISTEVNTLQAKFSVSGSSLYSGGAISVLVGSDPTNLSTFVPIDTIMVAAGSEMSPQLVSLNRYNGNGHYVMFYCFTGYVNLDNIKMETIPTCSMPTNLTVNDVSATTATITWVDEGATVEKWIVSCLKNGATVSITEEVIADDGPTCTLTNLEANTSYTVTVLTVCTTGDTNETLYPVIFRTECAEITLPYHEGFEDIAMEEFHMCWYRDDVTSVSPVDLPYWYLQMPSVYIGEGDGKTVLLSDNKAIISPRIPIPGNQISVSIDMKLQNIDYSGKLLVAFSEISNYDTSMIIIDTLSADDTEWHNYIVNFNTSNIIDTGYVVFKNVDNQRQTIGWFDNQYMLWIDNIDFSVYSSCTRPSNVVVNNITATSAEVSFDAVTDINSYTIAWNTEQNVTTAITNDVITTTASINNLLPSTTYYSWVRSNCSTTSHSSWVYAGKFTTECLAQSIPYYENFDSYSYGVSSDLDMPNEFPDHSLPDCWKVIGMTGVADQPPFAMISNSQQIKVSGNALAASISSDFPMYMVLPKFDTPIDSLMLKFSYINIQDNGRQDELVLGVMTDPFNIHSFQAIQNIPNVITSTEFEHVFIYDEVIASNAEYYIALKFGGIGTYYQVLGIDNLSVEPMPSCLYPINVHVNGITTTTASVSWQGLANNYEVQYRAVGEAIWTSSVVNVPIITLSNLVINSEYELKVRSVCGDNDSSDWSDIITFRTMCAAVAVPWTEDFDSYTIDISSTTMCPNTFPNHALPECWIFNPMVIGNENGPAVWLTSVANNDWVRHNVISGISMRLVSNESAPTYAILPLMDARIDSLALYFEYAMAEYGNPLTIGVVTNPYDFSTFIPVETFPVYDSAHSAEHYFIYDNLDITKDYYIAFKTYNGVSDVNTIDNIRVDFMPTCIRPGGMRAYSVTDNAATISWSTTASLSEVSYHAINENTWIDTIVNADTIRIIGLTGSSDYEIIVRSICGDGDTSEWSDTLTFRTECSPYVMPYAEDFSQVMAVSGLECWGFYGGRADDVIAGISELEIKDVYSTSWSYAPMTDALEGPHVYLNIFGVDRFEWMVTPQITITWGAVLSFDVAFVDYFYGTAPSDFADDKFYVLATTDNGSTWSKLMTWGSDVSDTYPMDSISVTGDSIAISLDQFVNQNVRFAFYGESTVMGGDNNLHIGNILVESHTPICPIPENLTSTPSTLSSVVVWTGEGQNYEVAIRQNGSQEWSDSVSVVGLTHTFNDLLPNTTYEYRVRQICSEGFYSDWAIAVFVTLDLPCERPVVNVSNITGDGATFIWNEGENHILWELNVFNAMTNELYDVTDTTYIATELAHATTYNVAVRAKCAENVYSDWSDTVEFTTLDCLPVTNVVANQITANSAVITWTAGADELQWIINYGDRDFAQGQGVFDTVSATTYTIAALEEDSYYDVYVRAMCGVDFTSTWSTPVCQFKTLVGGNEGIDAINGHYQFVIYPNPTHGTTAIILNGVEGHVTISVVDMNGRIIIGESIECSSDCEKRIDVTGLAQGTYFVRVLGNDINSVRKLIVR